MSGPSLQTERMRLRTLSACDTSFVERLIANRDVRKYLGGAVPPAERPAVIARYLAPEDGKLVWTARLNATDQPAGLVFVSKHKDIGDYELSYQFHPDVWGSGYALEACKAVMDYSVSNLGLKRLIAETQTANTASCKLLERLGMTRLKCVVRFGAEQAIYTT